MVIRRGDSSRIDGVIVAVMWNDTGVPAKVLNDLTNLFGKCKIDMDNRVRRKNVAIQLNFILICTCKQEIYDNRK